MSDTHLWKTPEFRERVNRFWRTHYRLRGIPPTQREAATELGLDESQHRMIDKAVKLLVEEGKLLMVVPKGSRAIIPVDWHTSLRSEAGAGGNKRTQAPLVQGTLL